MARATDGGRVSQLHPLLLDQHDLRPRPGLWVRVADHSFFRLRAPIPRHLRTTRLHRARYIPDGPDLPPLPPIRRAWLIIRTMRPFLVRGRDTAAPYFDARTDSRSEQRSILISTALHRVLHISDQPILCATSEELRSQWSQHIVSPAFRRSICGRRVEETLLEGRHVAELSSDAVSEVIRRLLRAHVRLAQGASRAPSAQLAALLPTNLRDFRSVVAPETASVDNLVVVDEHEPALIDVHPLAEMPFYAPPVRLLRNWARISSQPVRLIRDGAFDAEAAALLAAGNLTPPDPTNCGSFLLDLPTPTVRIPVTP
jgi:hypothetical protein